jgi:hypothetical protein
MRWLGSRLATDSVFRKKHTMKNKPNKQHATSPLQKREAKIQKLQLNKETIKDLTAHDAPAIKGEPAGKVGFNVRAISADTQ